MAAEIAGSTVNVELTPAAEISADVGGAAEIRVELTPAAEISVELTPDAEIGVKLEDGPTVAVQLAGGAELNFLPDGTLDHYYDKNAADALLAAKADAAATYTRGETDALLAGKAAAVHDHDDRYYTEAETDALLAGKANAADIHYRVYNSVTDIGLTPGSATITDAFDALPAYSMLIVNDTDFTNASLPITGWEGQIVICKGTSRWRSYIEANGSTATFGDYRMYLSGGSPTGTWLFQGAEGVVLFDNPSGATSGTLSSAIANFKRLKVTWGGGDRNYLFTQESYTHGASSVSLPVSYTTETSKNGNVYVSCMRIVLNGTTMSSDRNFNITIAPTSISSNAWTGRIYRVEGYYN